MLDIPGILFLGSISHSPKSGLELGKASQQDFYKEDELKYHGRATRGVLNINLLKVWSCRVRGDVKKVVVFGATYHNKVGEGLFRTTNFGQKNYHYHQFGKNPPQKVVVVPQMPMGRRLLRLCGMYQVAPNNACHRHHLLKVLAQNILRVLV